MAWLIRPLQRTLSSPHLRTLSSPHLRNLRLHHPASVFSSRSYISDMRKSAFQDNISRLLRKEIQYELDRCPPKQPATVFNSFTVEDRPGEQWVRLKRKFGENEDITIEATMFDGSGPVSKSGEPHEDGVISMTFIVNISKGDDSNVLEIVSTGFPYTLEIRKVYVRGRDRTPDRRYIGPDFEELDEELQESLYDFLEERSIDDELATFLHGYMKNKSITEFIRWLDTLRSCLEKK